MATTAAYQRGYQAMFSGGWRNQCPETSEEDRREWERGFDDATRYPNLQPATDNQR